MTKYDDLHTSASFTVGRKTSKPTELEDGWHSQTVR